MLPYIHQESQK